METRMRFLKSALTITAGLIAGGHAGNSRAGTILVILDTDIGDDITVIDTVAGRIVHCATSWKDLHDFEKRLSDILLG